MKQTFLGYWLAQVPGTKEEQWKSIQRGRVVITSIEEEEEMGI